MDIKKYYFDDPYFFKYCPDQLMKGVYPITIKLGCSPFSTRKLVEGISPQGKQRTKSYKMVFTGPLFSKTALNFSKFTLGVNN